MKRAFPLFSTMQEKIDRVNTVMRESLLGVRVIKAFAGQMREKKRFAKANDDLKNHSLKAMYLTVGMMPLVTLIMNLSVIALFWFGGNMAISGELSNGSIMAYLSYLTQVLSSLMMVAMLTINFTRAKACADRLNEVFDTEPAIAEKETPQQMRGWDVEFDHVSFSYNQGTPEYVLKDISFTAKPGQTIGIIGGTGSGKSTLVNLIPRLYDVSKGAVRLGGVDVRDLSLDALRGSIGVVLQESLLFSGTVAENLRWGDPDASDEQLKQALCDAQGLEFIEEREEGLNAPVEQRAKNFSGGQKQRLSIARAFVKKPKILILDDSTSAVDTATEAKIQQALAARKDDSIVFLIAQRISAISRADQILVLDDGRLDGIGTHEELLKNCEIYRSIAVSQLGEEVLAHV